MNEEMNLCLQETKEGMQKAIEHLKKEYGKLKAGKSSPDMLDGVMVDYYGTNTPISQVANIHTPDPRQIIVQPWEKSMLGNIEKAIQAANLGFNPQNNGEILRIIVPMLTEERRKELVGKAKNEAENAKISLRSVRKSSLDYAKSLKNDGLPEDEHKRLEDKIQEINNEFNEKVDSIFEIKEKDILTV